MRTTIFTHTSGLGHDTGRGDERIARLQALFEMAQEPIFAALRRGAIEPASEDQIMRAHRYSYFQKLKSKCPVEGHSVADDYEKPEDQETIMSPGSWSAILHAAGAVCSAVDDIVAGKTDRAFCMMRPPGHHAEPDKAMGFCFFNNVFIGARHAQEAHGIAKIAIVDFDVHHGNGTDAMTRQHDGSIFFIDTHEYPQWPNTGLPDDNDDTVHNHILAPGSGSKEFRAIYEQKVLPALEAFKPNLVIISAGFDAHRDDAIAGLNLVEDDYRWATEKLCDVANRHAQGRVISVLEGGYNLESLKNSAAAHLKALAAMAP